MEELPILMNGEMVRATLADLKTNTRRAMKVQPDGRHCRLDYEDGVLKQSSQIAGCWHVQKKFKCPYGVIGDRLYVRENMHMARELSTGGHWFDIFYTADNTHWDEGHGANDGCEWDDWFVEYKDWWNLKKDKCSIPSIHMPKWAARIWLEVTAVRVERVHEISEDDAKAEGIEFDGSYYRTVIHPVKGTLKCWPTAVMAFEKLWDSIYGKPRKDGTDISWSANPWVWVVEFKRVEP